MGLFATFGVDLVGKEGGGACDHTADLGLQSRLRCGSLIDSVVVDLYGPQGRVIVAGELVVVGIAGNGAVEIDDLS